MHNLEAYTGKIFLNGIGLTEQQICVYVCSAKYTYKWDINYPQALAARSMKYEYKTHKNWTLTVSMFFKA